MLATSSSAMSIKTKLKQNTVYLSELTKINFLASLAPLGQLAAMLTWQTCTVIALLVGVAVTRGVIVTGVRRTVIYLLITLTTIVARKTGTVKCHLQTYNI